MYYAWIPSVYGLIAAIVIGFAWWTLRRDDDLGSGYSFYQLVLRIGLVYVLMALVPAIPAYAQLVMQGARQSRAAVAQSHPQKLSVGALESNFVRVNHLQPNAGFRCKPADREWDYVCSYAPAPSKSPARLEFGVLVDEKRVLKVSPMLSAGSPLPSPQ